MSNESLRRTAHLLGTLSRQIHGTEQQILAPNQVRSLREALSNGGEVLHWSRVRGPAEIDRDIMMLTIAGAEAETADVASVLGRVLDEKAEIRVLISELQAMITANEFPNEVAYSYTVADSQGSYMVNEVKRMVADSHEAEGLIDDLWVLLRELDEITEAIQLELQHGLQQISMIVSTYSSISRLWHDEAKAIIENLRA